MRHWLSALNCLLAQVYWLCHELSEPLAAKTKRTVTLERGEVFCLTKHDRATCLQVKHGTVWLTGVPAGGDVILRAKDEFALTGPGPFVIEALSDLEMRVLG